MHTLDDHAAKRQTVNRLSEVRSEPARLSKSFLLQDGTHRPLRLGRWGNDTGVDVFQLVMVFGRTAEPRQCGPRRPWRLEGCIAIIHAEFRTYQTQTRPQFRAHPYQFDPIRVGLYAGRTRNLGT